jgi:hypothetical protein
MLLYGYSIEEARTMKAQIADWLRTTLKLTLSPDKTLITHWTASNREPMESQDSPDW